MTTLQTDTSHKTFPKPQKQGKGGYKRPGSSLTVYTPLKAKTGLKRDGKAGRGKGLKTRSQPKERRDAKLESKQRSGWRCLACGKRYPEGSFELEGHHIIPLSQGGEDVPENIGPLCGCTCHRGKGGIHRPEGQKNAVTHMRIYERALTGRPDIASHMELNIRSWVKHCNPDLADQLIQKLEGVK